MFPVCFMCMLVFLCSSSVHMEESSVMQGAQGVLVQNWPTASSAAGKTLSCYFHLSQSHLTYSEQWVSKRNINKEVYLALMDIVSSLRSKIVIPIYSLVNWISVNTFHDTDSDNTSTNYANICTFLKSLSNHKRVIKWGQRRYLLRDRPNPLLTLRAAAVRGNDTCNVGVDGYLCSLRQEGRQYRAKEGESEQIAVWIIS